MEIREATKLVSSKIGWPHPANRSFDLRRLADSLIGSLIESVAVLNNRMLIPAEFDIRLPQQAGVEMESLRQMEAVLAKAADGLLVTLNAGRPPLGVILRWVLRRPDLRGWMAKRIFGGLPWGSFHRYGPRWVLHYSVASSNHDPPGRIEVAARQPKAAPKRSTHLGVAVYRDGSVFGAMPLTSPALVAGRGDPETWVDLKFSLATVSRPHLLVRLAGQAPEVMDVSRNGTSIDGAPIKRGEWVRCGWGDQLCLGPVAWIKVLPASMALGGSPVRA